MTPRPKTDAPPLTEAKMTAAGLATAGPASIAVHGRGTPELEVTYEAFACDDLGARLAVLYRMARDRARSLKKERQAFGCDDVERTGTTPVTVFEAQDA